MKKLILKLQQENENLKSGAMKWFQKSFVTKQKLNFEQIFWIILNLIKL